MIIFRGESEIWVAEESTGSALTALANACRQKFGVKDQLTIDMMKDLILKYGGEDMLKLISNKKITGGAAVRVIANDDHTKISQELIELSKRYKYVRSSNDDKTWVSWSVLTSFS